MKQLSSIDILERLEIGEDASLEAKEAGGRDGLGGLPKSFFQSYVSMANTHGGVILLGVREKPKGVFTVVGIKDTSRVIKQIWDELNNRVKVSHNVLTNEMISVESVEGNKVIRVSVPRARRADKPIYLGDNPLTGTYRRNHEGDYLCDAETVKRMLAEQIEQDRDSILLPGFNVDDIDPASFSIYKQQFKATKPDHPWLDLEDLEFLRMIGGWTKNRDTGEEGLTLAGILMFGKLRSILDTVPNYILDYQERSQLDSTSRWTDRITTDGSWSGNLFDFYRSVIKKLTSELKVPFKLKGSSRIDDTLLHEALREALVNTLIHADYTGRVSVMIIKWTDVFGFRNPGLMRISIEEAIIGGTSDCRNRNLQKMFQLVGLGEQAGSGISKIWNNWKKEHWRTPQLSEQVDPDQTILLMKMVSLFPQEVIDQLEDRFGNRMKKFSELQRLALATVCIDEYVTHAQLKSMSSEHPRDITLMLAGLVREGILESAGTAKLRYYYFTGEPPSMAGKSFDLEGSVPLPQSSVPSASVPLPQSSVPLKVASVPSTTLIQSIRTKKKVPKVEMRQAILELCTGEFITLKVLAETLGRSSEYLRIKHLNEMVSSGALKVKYPDTPSHPLQAYKSANM